MNIAHLSIVDFRNFTQLSANFSPTVNIFYGNNGAGKTNLLEALFVLCLGRSQRRAADIILLRHGQEVYRLEGDIECRGRSSTVAVAYQRGARRKVTIDDITVPITELYEAHAAVSLGPEDGQILSGPPSGRRSFLDIYLSQYSCSYLSHLTDYQRALLQKNACLKADGDTTPFDSLMINHGAEVMAARQRFIDRMDDLAGDYYADIAGQSRLSLTYQPSFSVDGDGTDIKTIHQSFEAALARQRQRESLLKASLTGPHRDEIMFQIGDYPARTHGSQGECRTAAIALKLAVYCWLRDARKIKPVLLLDEVFAELDRQRSEALMQSLGDFGQLFMTTAVEPPQSLRDRSRNFRIHQANIQDMS
ncbi:MAG: DNA replication/repair protein RecF [bacterium]